MKISTVLRKAAEKCDANPLLQVWRAVGKGHGPAHAFFGEHISEWVESSLYSLPFGGARRQSIRVLALLLASEMAKEQGL